MNPDPLVDLDARLLSISSNTPTPIVIDRLLRLQNGDDWQEPITVYISPAEDNRSIGVLDFLQIYAVTRVLRSPIHTVALGTLRGYVQGQQSRRHPGAAKSGGTARSRIPQRCVSTRGIGFEPFLSLKYRSGYGGGRGGVPGDQG